MERKDDIFAISHETNNVNIAHQVSYCSLTWGHSPLGTTPSVMLPSSPVQTGRSQSMAVESER